MNELTARIATLRAELRDDTAFVATPTPRLSWTVEADAARMGAGGGRHHGRQRRPSRSTAGTACSSRGRSPRSHPARRARSRCVRGRPTARETAWSAPRPSRGRLPRRRRVDRAARSDWRMPAREAQPALVRTTFTIDRPVQRALLFWTALGVAEPELNGAAVSDDVLSPGWTSYRDRLVHETVDVTALVREGENVLGATIAGAWYTEKYGFFDFAARLYGTQPSFLAQLRVTYADGAVETLAATGDGWTRLRRRPGRRQRHLRGRAPGPAPRRVRLVGIRLRGLPLDARCASAPPRTPATRTSRCPRRASRRRCAASQSLPVADHDPDALGRHDPRLRSEPRRAGCASALAARPVSAS